MTYTLQRSYSTLSVPHRSSW